MMISRLVEPCTGNRKKKCSSITPLTLGVMLILATGCSVFRGIPTHGGGKRFDEEQWAVAASARLSAFEMDLKELRGKRTTIIITSIAHSGGGYTSYPRIEKLAGSYSRSNSFTGYDFDYYLAPPYATPFARNSEYDTSYRGQTGGGEINPSFDYRPFLFDSESDADYVRAAVTMKAFHDGVIVVLEQPEAYLYVLVDVLGTNRSRQDSILYWKDSLRARCHLTYYASNAMSTEIPFPARQSSAAATYQESSFLGFSGMDIQRSTERLDGELLPVSSKTDSKPKGTISSEKEE